MAAAAAAAAGQSSDRSTGSFSLWKREAHTRKGAWLFAWWIAAVAVHAGCGAGATVEECRGIRYVGYGTAMSVQLYL